ncbi:MAG: UvrD-helicase domain-containing protein [Chloroflexota bacterium]
MELTSAQQIVLGTTLGTKIFLSGPAGCGKTTVGVHWMLSMLASGILPESVLVLTPQRTLQEPYEASLRNPSAPAAGQVTMATMGGLARRMVELFWPIVVESAGFAHPDRTPQFLTIETAQYHMARIVRPLLNQGYFDSLTIDRNRLYSQIIDNLNKAATVGFPHKEIGERLSAAWLGDPVQRRVYTDAQECADRFREYCLENNLLDFSLQLEIFRNTLWHTPECRHYLTQTYRHLIYDNVEEDVPITHELIMDWLSNLDSALIINDEGGGYRRFLGADPESARGLSKECDSHISLMDSFITSAEVQAFEREYNLIFQPQPGRTQRTSPGWQNALVFPPGETPTRFYPQMLDWVTLEVRGLLESGVPANEIVILAPYLSDALRFSLAHRLDQVDIPWRSHRPSRSLRDEPAAQCLLTLSRLAHPGWNLSRPGKFDLAYAFMLALDTDLVRAQLLAEIVYRPRDCSLAPFERINPEMQERITFQLGARYTLLRAWLQEYRESTQLPLDHFLRRLFGEVLSQPGFGFQTNFDSVRVTASLVESIKKFRQALEPGTVSIPDEEESPAEQGANMGEDYIAMLIDGVIAAQYLEAWNPSLDDAVLIAPAFTFLMMNRPAMCQFWLDIGSSGWWERLSQPLTQPYVLSRQWEPGKVWTDADEVAANQQTLQRLITGLLRRCRERIYLGLTELGESGYEQRGPLLKAIWRMQVNSDVVV